MNFSIGRPTGLYGLLLLVPAFLFVMLRFRSIIRNLSAQYDLNTDKAMIRRTKRSFLARTFFNALGWIFLVLAYSKISWGTSSVPVQKNGRAVSFVFDISYSMLAPDAPGGMTRLDAAASYADEILEYMPYTSVSVVLAKGDGVLAVPMTEDFESVRSILKVLDPRMLTSQGSCLGKGIECAIDSFPGNSAQASYIWLFTDGEETDSGLSTALSEAMRRGIESVLIGFGSERETTVMAGDGVTPVKTALRTEKIEETIRSVKRKNSFANGNGLREDVFFVDASEAGSANRLLTSLGRNLRQQKNELNLKNSPQADSETTIVYELQSVERTKMFIVLSILCVVLSFLLGEFNPSLLSAKKKAVPAVSLVFALLLSGCSSRFTNAAKLLEGKLEWNRKNYSAAAADFLEAYESSVHSGDEELSCYASFALASTFLAQNENEAAKKHFEHISAEAPDHIRFAVLYNQGIIAHREGDFKAAAACFKDALKIDGSNIDAKINLELSLQEEQLHTRSREQEVSQTSESSSEQSALQNAIYSIIRENEQKQWKNQQQDSESSKLDF